jgi:hypothetical protein
VIATGPIRAWCLVNGVWTERDDPVMARCDPHGGDVSAAMAALGFEPWCRVGEREPVTLTVYSRESPPLQFLLQLEGNAGNVVEHVFTETLPDAMELLAKWAPAAQTGALIGMVRRLARHALPTSPVG